MMFYLQAHQGYLGILLQTYMNSRELGFSILCMRSSFDKGHKEVGTICFSLFLSRCAPCDCFEELGKNSWHHLNKVVSSNLLGDYIVFLN